MRILICEDEPHIATILEQALVHEGYQIAVAPGRAVARDFLETWGPDLVLLDIMLPESRHAGWDLLREIRVNSDIPVIVISGLGRVDDRVKALQTGADDFITKPFHVSEVLARIQAVLRRGGAITRSTPIAIDDERKEVRVNERVVRLSPKEYRLLRLLASSPGRVFSSDEIKDELWPMSAYADVQDVQKYVYLLRNKLEIDPKDPQLILTVRGFGYRLAA